MTLVLAAHGTREPAGAVAILELADQVRTRLPGVPVRVAFADVRTPDLTTVLDSIDGPAVVVPAFLAAGYHVRVDIPTQARKSATPVAISAPLGPAPTLVSVLHSRLVDAGWLPGDAVVLAAAGSSDPHALRDTRRAATLLGARTGTPVHIGFITTSTPHISDAVAHASAGARRVAIASWLLASGLFHTAATQAGAALTAAPLAPHPRIADLIIRRYTETRCYHLAA